MSAITSTSDYDTLNSDTVDIQKPPADDNKPIATFDNLNKNVPRRTEPVDYEAELKRYEQFQKVRDRILRPEDWIVFINRKTKAKSKALKKQGVYKLASIARLTVDTERIRYAIDDEGNDQVEVLARAIAPDNASSPGLGIATSDEFKNRMTLHNRASTAETRAKVRAISEQLGLDDRLADDLAVDEIPVAGNTSTTNDTGGNVGNTAKSQQKPVGQCNCHLRDTVKGKLDEPSNLYLCGNCNRVIIAAKLRAMEQKR